MPMWVSAMCAMRRGAISCQPSAFSGLTAVSSPDGEEQGRILGLLLGRPASLQEKKLPWPRFRSRLCPHVSDGQMEPGRILDLSRGMTPEANLSRRGPAGIAADR